MVTRNFFVFVLLSVLSFSVFALERKVFCIWDPVGRNGPVMSFYSDVIPKAQSWGLSIRFVAYTDERIAASDFKAGRCEAVLLTSILARQFVKFGGTMDAIGAINSQEGLETALSSLARPKAGKLMTEGKYEAVATFPVGSMYAFVNDRTIDTIEEFAGKSISILNGDPQMKKFADLAGASQVNVTLDSFAELFNKGNVDIVVMPALAYNTFELYQGLGSKGGIIDKRLYYGMLQTITKRDQFPEDFGHTMRNYVKTRMKAINKLVKDAEEEIPDIQFHMSSVRLDNHGLNLSFTFGYGYSGHACVLRPKSRGTLKLKDANPNSHPLIDPNLLDHPDDFEGMVRGVKAVRNIFAQKAFDSWRGDEIFPGNHVQSDEEIFIKSKELLGTVFHPVGTCKMGNDDNAVVNHQLQVHGINHLRVVDASIMPTLIGGNTNAPTIMIAEKASEMIKASAKQQVAAA
mgnify:CR=1 FL=1